MGKYRKPVIAGNWKMNKTIKETKEFFDKYLDQIDTNRVEVVICPTLTSIPAALEATKGTNVGIGAQNLFYADGGAYTGEVTADMLVETGCQYVIIGHSERRQYFNETDEAVNLKLKKALEKGLIPIPCVGETLEEREAGETFDVLKRQTVKALEGIDAEDAKKIILAYEPVWAIGTGKTATDDQANEACGYIRKLVDEIYGEDVSERIRILYGGSVNEGNVKALMAMSDIDGALVGGASLKESFVTLVNFNKPEQTTGKSLLMILDGYGHSRSKRYNAVYSANTPNLDRLVEECPNMLIEASGMAVGLPMGQMGNSEVGHLNLGAGRIVYQELTRIKMLVDNVDDEFFYNEAFMKAVDNCKKYGTALHLMGMVSDGCVHASDYHLFGLLEIAKREGLDKVYVHCFMDGRDTLPTSGKGYIQRLEVIMEEAGVGEIATVIGRYYAMDRDNNWDRTKKAYDCLVYGKGNHAELAEDAMQDYYDAGITDEFIEPTVIGEPKIIDKHDSVIFFNYRPDRARQITRALVEPFVTGGFERRKDLDLMYVTFTELDATFMNVHVAFKPQSLKNTLGEYLSSQKKVQLRIAETEKYAHVTYFFNGGNEKVNDDEHRILVPSPKVATYDLKPEMSAYEVRDKLVAAINTEGFDNIVCNFANCDMVGHTGNFEAAVKAVETVDECVGDVIAAAKAHGYSTIITADHGNAEKMVSQGGPCTTHTTNRVRCIVVSDKVKGLKDPREFKKGSAALCNIAPTLLDMMDLEIPEEMTGQSMVIKK